MVVDFGYTGLADPAKVFGNRLRLADGPLELSWQHCSTTADFIGEFFALRQQGTGRNYNDARHSIGYLLNELLENAVKFRAPGDIVLQTGLDDDRFTAKVTNVINDATSERFKLLLEEITSRDPGELLIERIEANAEDVGSSGSGLGLLTLMNDYGVSLRWTFSPLDAGGGTRLETYAALDLV